MSTALLAPVLAPPIGEQLERVLITGDLSTLKPDERVRYYNAVCHSVGLNPLTKPFEYINLNGKLRLYALRDATDQLRKIHAVSIKILARELVEDVYVVTAQATDRAGRTDESIGAVNVAGLRGEARANAMMKAETKAKRRVTLSICGLGMLDETEVDSIPGAQIVPTPPPPTQLAATAALGGEKRAAAIDAAVAEMATKPQIDNFLKRCEWLGFSDEERAQWLMERADVDNPEAVGKATLQAFLEELDHEVARLMPPDPASESQRRKLYAEARRKWPAPGNTFDRDALKAWMEREHNVRSLKFASASEVSKLIDALVGGTGNDKSSEARRT